jgi:glutamyl-tRNA synthetase
MSRSKKEYEDSILSDVSWLGINYDEFFRQSERIDRYHDVMQALVQSGIVYKCYETPDELAYKRKVALSKGQTPVYDRASLNLSAEDISKIDKDGTPHYWRFKLPNAHVSWNDIVLGDISYDLNSISDPVIMKADGSFLYTFTSVVDDIDYHVTHIIRGQDHVTNTAAQIAMFMEIAGRHPEFAHLSLFVNKDGSQFSKRLGSMNLRDIKESGIDHMSVVNFLATFGSSLDPRPFLSVSDLADYFDIRKFSTNSPKFDIDNVLLFNKKILHLRTYDEIKNVLGQEFTISPGAFEAVKENVSTYEDIKEWSKILSPGFESNLIFSENEIKILRVAIELVQNVEQDHMIQAIKDKTGVSGKDLYIPLRKSITGKEHGPDLLGLLRVIGKNEIEKRLRRCIEH